MRATLELEVEGLVENLVRVKAFHPKAHQAATLVIAEHFVKEIDKVMKTHNDTNRYINGWIGALRDAGIQSIPMRPYKDSKRREEYLEALAKQYDGTADLVDKLESQVEFYEREDRNATPRKDGKPRKKRMNQPHVKKLVKNLRWWTRRRDKVLKIYEDAITEHAILFFHRRVHHRKTRDFHTIRTKIYGGSGRILIVGNQVIVELRNLEAHPRLVERNPKIGHPVRTAYSKLRAFGLRRASKRYMATMEKLYKPKPGDAIVIANMAEAKHAKKFAS